MFKLFNHKIELYSPIDGEVIDLELVPDKVFAQKLMGDGIGLINNSNKVYAPCDATVTMVPYTKHAVGLVTKNGAEILIHVGLDTVNLNGEGMEIHVKEGDKVRKNDLLISYDQDFMKARNINLITPMVITNSSEYKVDITVCNTAIDRNTKVAEINKQ